MSLRRPGLRHDEDELFTATPNENVDPAHRLADAIGKETQNGIAGSMTEPIVHRLEVVEIHVEEADVSTCSPCPLHFLDDARRARDGRL